MDKHSDIPRIYDRAVLIGYNPEDQCVYSDIIELGDYYDDTHVWDESENVKKLRLHKIKGFLFDSEGVLSQEFESVFDLNTGIYRSGYARFADGTFREDKSLD
jgi:hypothetical protein